VTSALKALNDRRSSKEGTTQPVITDHHKKTIFQALDISRKNMTIMRICVVGRALASFNYKYAC
jgi:hypothetical protein